MRPLYALPLALALTGCRHQQRQEAIPEHALDGLREDLTRAALSASGAEVVLHSGPTSDRLGFRSANGNTECTVDLSDWVNFDGALEITCLVDYAGTVGVHDRTSFSYNSNGITSHYVYYPNKGEDVFKSLTSTASIHGSQCNVRYEQVDQEHPVNGVRSNSWIETESSSDCVDLIVGGKSLAHEMIELAKLKRAGVQL